MYPTLRPADSRAPIKLLCVVLTADGQLQLRMSRCLFARPMLPYFMFDVGTFVLNALGTKLRDGQTAYTDALLYDGFASDGLVLTLTMDDEKSSVDVESIIAGKEAEELSRSVGHFFFHLMEGSVCSDREDKYPAELKAEVKEQAEIAAFFAEVLGPEEDHQCETCGINYRYDKTHPETEYLYDEVWKPPYLCATCVRQLSDKE